MLPATDLDSVPAAERSRRRARVFPLVPLLAGVWIVVLAGVGVLLIGGPGHELLSGPWQTVGPPTFREVTYSRPQAVLGRDFVVAPSDATAEKIEWVLLTVAGEDSSRILRINVFTSEQAARRRRELIDEGIFAKSDDEDEPDPPEWTDVYPGWVGIYTRDPANGVHQLSICLADPGHEHCAVRRLS